MLSAPQKKPSGVLPPLTQTQSFLLQSQLVPGTLPQSTFGFLGSVLQSQSGESVADSTQSEPLGQVDLSSRPRHVFRSEPLVSTPACPSGQLTRPWKWFTRQMRVAHWN